MISGWITLLVWTVKAAAVAILRRSCSFSAIAELALTAKYLRVVRA
jgi:hypothetical protein